MAHGPPPSPPAPSADDPQFRVAGWVDWFGGFIARHPRLWIALGNLETRLLSDVIGDGRIEHPVYVAGLARSGSTILLELLAQHEHVATHRYRDYPPVFTPYWWNRWLDRVPRPPERPAERTHRDRIAITSESPEAFEEVLWMAFFPHLHDPSRSDVLGGDTENPRFEAFYRDHLRKLLAVRQRRRYVAKGNYNLTRFGYLQKIFPDARFVVPVRDPVWHIASLMKQHRLFTEGQRANPKAREHLKRVGHFEFGLDRSPVNAGDDAAVARILSCWRDGRDVQGWACYWSHLYERVLAQLETNAPLRGATLIVRYEDLCRSPRTTLRAVLDHCKLPLSEPLLREAEQRLSLPAYYAPDFNAADLATIERETRDIARRMGYGQP